MSLKDENIKYVNDLISKGKKPAVAISVELNGIYFSDYSRLCDSCLNHKLRSKLRELGNLYTHNGINIIGNCAEVNAANQILEVNSSIPLNRIQFSEALRPRTKQIINRCSNCNNTFS